MKTNYIGHDNVYKKHKVKGKAGWDPTPEVTRETMDTIDKVLQADYVPKSGQLLELGCGAGNITLWLAQKGYDVSGIDIAPTAITWAREKAKELNLKAGFRVGSVLDLKDYADNSFGFVLDGHCLHCIIGPDRKPFLASALRVLKPGGFFLVNSMCGEVLNEEMKKQFDPSSRCLVSHGVASRYLGFAEDILNEVKEAGFKVLKSEISPRKNNDDFDTLLVHATKPR